MPVSQGRQNSTISSRSGLSLNVYDGEITFTSIGSKLYEASISTQCREQDDEMWIELSLNARNFSIRWGCRDKYMSTKGHTELILGHLAPWDGQKPSYGCVGTKVDKRFL